jgi:hypothetical protein
VGFVIWRVMRVQKNDVSSFPLLRGSGRCMVWRCDGLAAGMISIWRYGGHGAFLGVITGSGS